MLKQSLVLAVVAVVALGAASRALADSSSSDGQLLVAARTAGGACADRVLEQAVKVMAATGRETIQAGQPLLNTGSPHSHARHVVRDGVRILGGAEAFPM